MTSSPDRDCSASSAAVHCPELLAPAGSWDCAKAAVENGADAIYFGLDQFNARMRAHNFTEADLPDLMAFLHQRGVKGYLTLNTLIFTAELPAVESYIRSIIRAGVDAVIVQDVGLCRLIRQLSPDLPIHASTQMTITSAAGVAFAQDLGCQLVVLARETSIKDLEKIQAQCVSRSSAMSSRPIPLEMFVHGALCVAYSGQCLTSEALGGRSANRGECAQACRMTYDLIVDGQHHDLGDRRYLLSPQDLSGLEMLPELVKAGIASFKVEGRLKSPDYVASVTRVYRQALDQVMQDLDQAYHPSAREQYQLEMAFSRGLYSGWFKGINNQELVHARFGKKRGVWVGTVTDIQNHRVMLTTEAPLKAGDGVVFDSGHPGSKEEGGRIYTIDRHGKQVTITFGKKAVNVRRIHRGDRVWKTNDPELDKQVRQTFAGDIPKFQRPIDIDLHGIVGQPLTAIVRDGLGHCAQVASKMPLMEAERQPLTRETLEKQLGRLGNTPFTLGRLTFNLEGPLMLPISALNQMRRDFVAKLIQVRSQPIRWQYQASTRWNDLLPDRSMLKNASNGDPELIVLVRSLEQLQAVLETSIPMLYCEFEDPRVYQIAVQQVRADRSGVNRSIWVAPPRITKPRENWILDQVKRCEADGYLIRNYDHLQYFAHEQCIADFSFNVANPITANYLKQTYSLNRLTASYDLTIQQLSDLLAQTPPSWLEITLHQHMPMFHMEHCVFCAFLSEGTDFTNCGRPCETHQVKLRDRVGTEHILQADAGCRNTVFNGTAQTGAESIHLLLEAGARHFRLEFLDESSQLVLNTIQNYQDLLSGKLSGTQLWRNLQINNQLGVTRGALALRSRS